MKIILIDQSELETGTMILPPLVAPDATLSSAELTSYSRHLLMPGFGPDGQRRLKHSRVLVIGAGGLGSPVLLYLGAAGVGTLGVIDFDVVEASNLQRQILHGVADIGQPKTGSAVRALRERNPWIHVRSHRERFDAGNARALLADYDLVVDCSDNFASRYLVNDSCVLAGKPYVWGAIFRFEGQVSVFWEQAPGGAGPNYRDLYPSPPLPARTPSCAEGGVLGVLCGTIGTLMATEAIKLITGIGTSLLGRLLIYDALDMSLRCLPLRRAPQREAVTGLGEYPAGRGAAGEGDAPVPSLRAQELQQLLARHEPVVLIDIRERFEWDIVRIDGARHIPRDELIRQDVLETLDKSAAIVLHCKHGLRSRQVLRDMQGHGFRNVKHLDGGIIAWIRDVEPGLPCY